MFKAWIDLVRWILDPIRVDQLHQNTGLRDASGSLAIRNGVFRRKGSFVIVRRTRSRSCSKDILMGRKAWTLVRLKHEIGPTILLGQREIWVQDTAGIVDEPELRF